MSTLPITPRDAGFRMPAEWAPHAATVMIWPSRASLWDDRLDSAGAEYAAVANAIAAFEPVFMVCQSRTMRRRYGVPAPRTSSRCRSVRTTPGRATAAPASSPTIRASWQWSSSASTPGAIASTRTTTTRWCPIDWLHISACRVFSAPMILEGGSFFVDGEGTLITTEQCLLDPNRNPHMSKEQIESVLADYLGVTTFIWLPFGHSLDTGPVGTDGHVDGVAQYVAPGRVMLEYPTSPESTEYERARANLAVLEAATDAGGRQLTSTCWIRR